jgi:hypothetical protein
MGGLVLLLTGFLSTAMGEELLRGKPLFMNSYREGRLFLAAGKGNKDLFLLNKREGTLSRIDPESGRSSVLLAHLRNPQNIAVGRDGNRILLDLGSSRTLLVAPLTVQGPPAAISVGLNPGQIIRGSDDQYYLVAEAVHILYTLDPVRYHPKEWVAVGEPFRRVAADEHRNLLVPLSRSGQVMEIHTAPFAPFRKYPIEGCHAPLRVVPLPEGGFVAGCRNAILRMGPQGDFHRLSLRNRPRHGLRDLLLSSDATHLLALFHHEKSIVILKIKGLGQNPSVRRVPYSPVRLFLFGNWPILFVVMNDPDHDKTWLFGYPLLSPSKNSTGPSVQITSLPRKKK